MHQAVSELEEMLASATPATLPGIRMTAAARAEEVRGALGRFGELKNKILGVSGGAGLLELVSSGDRAAVAASIYVEEVNMGDNYTGYGVGAMGRGATASNFNVNQAWNDLQVQDTAKLAAELAVLREH